MTNAKQYAVTDGNGKYITSMMGMHILTDKFIDLYTKDDAEKLIAMAERRGIKLTMVEHLGKI